MSSKPSVMPEDIVRELDLIKNTRKSEWASPEAKDLYYKVKPCIQDLDQVVRAMCNAMNKKVAEYWDSTEPEARQALVSWTINSTISSASELTIPLYEQVSKETGLALEQLGTTTLEIMIQHFKRMVSLA